MAKTTSKKLEPIGNENSYTKEFFEELYKQIGLTAQSEKYILKRTIILSAQSYLTHYDNYLRELAAHKIKEELNRANKNLKKAGQSIAKVIASGNYGDELAENLSEVISKKHPMLNSLIDHIKREEHFFTIYSPAKSLAMLAAMEDSIDLTLEKDTFRKTTPKSEALYHWVMIMSAKLEPIIDHKLEQSRYYNGEYISKREISDSELLQFIIKPLDPNVTISQIETAIKDTRQERHDAPWNDYF